jgi:RNA polymerase sigma-70 factor (ECF subfamily)
VAGEARRTRLRLRRRPYEELPAPSARDLDRELDIQRAVHGLPKRMRLAVELHYFVGLSVIETAQVMNVSEGTAKSTLHDARARLRPQLDGHLASEGT